eukprot:scaffold33157_cov57-Phaeocystis_antarctica.AAC.2
MAYRMRANDARATGQLTKTRISHQTPPADGRRPAPKPPQISMTQAASPPRCHPTPGVDFPVTKVAPPLRWASSHG